MNTKPLVVIGSLQEHASIKSATICTTLTSAMGMGGGQIPMIITKRDINGTDNFMGFDKTQIFNN